MTFAISTVHMAVAQLKPFNPILGETFQTKINDVMFYMEQTSHHPPIFNYYVKINNLPQDPRRKLQDLRIQRKRCINRCEQR